jgi:hypothetical protein
MKSQKEYWIEVVGTTYLYYRVRARSKREALRKYTEGQEDYVGCVDATSDRIRAILSEPPQVQWH